MLRHLERSSRLLRSVAELARVPALRPPLNDPKSGDFGCEESTIDTQRNLRFVRLFAQHEHQVYAYIVSVLANWADADEVMQETSVALWEMFDDFQEGTSFCSWACRIAYFR